MSSSSLLVSNQSTFSTNDDNNNIDHINQNGFGNNVYSKSVPVHHTSNGKGHQLESQSVNLANAALNHIDSRTITANNTNTLSHHNSQFDSFECANNPALSVLRKSIVSPSAQHKMSSINTTEQDDDQSSSRTSPDFYHGNHLDNRWIEHEKLINCDDVEIERHQPGRHRSPLISLLKRLFTCSPYFAKFFSALFYAISSLLIVVINKIVLTNYRYVYLIYCFLLWFVLVDYERF